MRPDHIPFNPGDRFHAHVGFLLSLWCWACLHEFESADCGPASETFRQWCADTSERAKAAGWLMIDERPYCPKCAASRQVG